MDINHVVTPKRIPDTEKKTNVRWIIVVVLFFITAINYADRATISLAGPEIAKELKMDSISMGYIFFCLRLVICHFSVARRIFVRSIWLKKSVCV